MLVKVNGVVIVRLFGNKLCWPNMQHMTLLTPEQIDQLIVEFEVIKYDEEFYEDGDIIQHAYNLILKKIH